MKYQYLLGKVSTRTLFLVSNEGLTYQYLLGKVSTSDGAGASREGRIVSISIR